MEALVAVSLSGAVVQFVQFAGKLIEDANSIKDNGTTSSIPDLRKLAEDLTKQADDFRKHLRGNNAALRQDDENLADICAECYAAGTDFISFLDTLVPQSASSNVLQSVRASIKCRFKHRKVEDFVSKLVKLQNALSLATILALRTSADANTEDILLSLRQIQQDFQGQAVQTQQNVQTLVSTLQGQGNTDLGTISAQLEKALRDIELLRNELPRDCEKAILRWLYFRQISWRYQEIPIAYQKTYEWVLKPPLPGNRWDDFKAHLLSQDIATPYFVYGKAGCGKSTLLKFIAHHKETHELLTQWAGNDELIVVKFFSWNLGTTLQKSAVGMLRTLTHSLLEKHPELIPIAFPEIYNHWDPEQKFEDPTYVELIECFQRILATLATFSRICIFIDGIDEFEGEHRDLSEFIRSLANSKVKVVVSSRPINTCLQVFRDCPTLRLQDLTKDDMNIYIQGQLASRPIMLHMMGTYPEESAKILHDLQEKAQGVFLWVKLVVHMLLNGVEAGDNIQKLHDKLLLLPNDLRELYRHMFSKISPEYQIQAANIFRLLEAVKSANMDLAPLMLYFAMQPPSLETTEVPNLKTLDLYHDSSIAQIRNHCCGLLEAYSGENHPESMRGQTMTHSPNDHITFLETFQVDYIHRTVQEFLSSEDIRDQVLQLSAVEFDPYVSLASAFLAVVNTLGSLGLLEFDRAKTFWINVIISFYEIATPQAQRNVHLYLDALDKAMVQLQKSYSEKHIIYAPVGENWLKSFVFYYLPTSLALEWCDKTLKYQIDEGFSFGCMAAMYGHKDYFQYHCTARAVMDPLQKAALLVSTLAGFLEGGELGDNVDILIFLLRNVISSEDRWGRLTLLGFSMNCFQHIQRYQAMKSDETGPDWEEIILGCFVAIAHVPKKVIQEYRSLYSSRDLPRIIELLRSHDEPICALAGQVEAAFKASQAHEDPEISSDGQLEAAFEDGQTTEGIPCMESLTQQEEGKAPCWSQRCSQIENVGPQNVFMNFNSEPYKQFGMQRGQYPGSPQDSHLMWDVHQTTLPYKHDQPAYILPQPAEAPYSSLPLSPLQFKSVESRQTVLPHRPAHLDLISSQLPQGSLGPPLGPPQHQQAPPRLHTRAPHLQFILNDAPLSGPTQSHPDKPASDNKTSLSPGPVRPDYNLNGQKPTATISIPRINYSNRRSQYAHNQDTDAGRRKRKHTDGTAQSPKRTRPLC